MKRIGMMVFLALLIGSINGCGKEEENTVQEPQWETVEEEEEEALVEGLIEDQSFEVELDGWGKVFFASAAPSEDGGQPHFMLLKDNEVVYTFPETPKSADEKFVQVGAVAFRDYNMDGKKDVLVLVTYSDGLSSWNEPRVFLQENSDNMFYLDYPDMESYRVFQDTESYGEEMGGEAFYRDTFLEEYLSEQGLTDSIAAFSESWADYVGYLDSLSGFYGVESQIELFAKSREIWTEGMDYANDVHRFTLASMGYDGKLTLIVANQGGTGFYTYSEFYQIDEKGELKRLETSFKEGDSQPDIIEESMTVYSRFSLTGNRNYFIVHDMLKDSPGSYVNRVSSLSIQDGFILETPLADQTVIYEGEDQSARISSEDCNGNILTEEEYENFADTYYSNMGMTKQTAGFEWVDVSSLDGADDGEAEEILKRAYEGFSLK